jgi:hypothetical protein
MVRAWTPVRQPVYHPLEYKTFAGKTDGSGPALLGGLALLSRRWNSFLAGWSSDL